MTDSKPSSLSSVTVEQCTISSEYLEREVIVDVYLPSAMIKPEQ
jgi:hypothetical protein